MATPTSEYLVNTQPHARNKTYRIIVRDLTRNVTVNQIIGGQVKRPWSIQVLQNGHLVIGYSLVRPFDYDFYNDEGQLYNHMESDCDKCWILKNGLMVEVAGKQTIVKQVMPEFKPPRIIQIYDLAAQWVDWLGSANDLLVAHTFMSERSVGHLHMLRLDSSHIETTMPVCITNVQLRDQTLYGTTPGGDYAQCIDLQNWYTNGFVRTTTTPVGVRRQKLNDIKLKYINDQFMIYKNAQKQHVRDVESTSFYLIDWKKRETIWHTQQDIDVIATSQNDSRGAYFVYHDVDACAYFLLVCGSSVVTPIPLLTNLKPKGESRFLSNGTFVFHGEKRIVVLDIDSSTILAQYDVSRHACDLMTLSRFDYKTKTKPVEVDIDDTKHAAEIQAMVEQSEIPPPPPPLLEPTTPIVIEQSPPPQPPTPILAAPLAQPDCKKPETAVQSVVVPPMDTPKTIESLPVDPVSSTHVVPPVAVVPTDAPKPSTEPAPVPASACSIM